MQESLLFFYLPPLKNMASSIDTAAIKLNQSKHIYRELQGSTKPGGEKTPQVDKNVQGEITL